MVFAQNLEKLISVKLLANIEKWFVLCENRHTTHNRNDYNDYNNCLIQIRRSNNKYFVITDKPYNLHKRPNVRISALGLSKEFVTYT